MEGDYLFSKKEMYSMSCRNDGKVRLPGLTPYRDRQKRYGNMHLLSGLAFTTANDFPIVQPYCGTTDFTWCSYVEMSKHNGVNEAVHFFVNDFAFVGKMDYAFEKVTYQLRKFSYIMAPDYSMYIDSPKPINKMAVFRNRFAAAYWQSIGFNVIPTASWSDVDSFEYAFEGLPLNSVIAVSGQGHRRHSGLQTLWRWAIQEIEHQLSPIEILIYGEEEDIPGVHTPLKFHPDYIKTHLRNVRK